jgi:DNA-binding PadR family transcriptional regulator
MYLNILILAELTSGPAHGYELRRRIRKTLGGRVELNTNTVYPALRRFEAEGALVRYEDQRSGAPPRYVYQLTEAGRRQLHEMVMDLTPILAQDDKEFLTRVACFGLLSPEEQQELLAIRREALAIRDAFLGELEKTYSSESAPDFDTAAAAGGADFRTAYDAAGRSWQQHVLRYCRSQLMAEYRWLDQLSEVSLGSGKRGQVGP